MSKDSNLNLQGYSKIKGYLDEKVIEYTEYRHKPVRTSEEAAKIRGSKLSEGAKALIFLADGVPIQIVIRGDKRVDTESVKRRLNLKKLKMAGPEEAEKLSGTQVGGVPPFGNLFDQPIPVYVISSLLENDEIEFNAGDRSISIRMKTIDWQKAVGPVKIEG